MSDPKIGQAFKYKSVLCVYVGVSTDSKGITRYWLASPGFLSCYSPIIGERNQRP